MSILRGGAPVFGMDSANCQDIRHVWLKFQKEMIEMQNKPQKPDQKINLYFSDPFHARKNHHSKWVTTWSI